MSEETACRSWKKSEVCIRAFRSITWWGCCICAPQERENKAKYVLLHSTNEICVNKPVCSTPLPNEHSAHRHTKLTVLVEITGEEKWSETLPFTFQLQVCVLKHWHFTCNFISISNERWKLFSLGTRPSDCVSSLSVNNIIKFY